MESEYGESSFGWLHRYPVLNLRFLLRSTAFLGNLTVFILISIELGQAMWHYKTKNENEIVYKEDLEEYKKEENGCKKYNGEFMLPTETWHIYNKLQSLCLSLWLGYKICYIFLSLGCGT